MATIAETKTVVKIINAIWLVLLVPWLPFAAFCGMAFDGGYTWHAYMFVWSTLLYPATVLVALVSRQKLPPLVLLPLLCVAGFFVSGLQ
jgi:hypothetical protein